MFKTDVSEATVHSTKEHRLGVQQAWMDSNPGSDN